MNASVAISFSEKMDTGTLPAAIRLRRTGGGPVVAGTVVPGATVTRFVPAANLDQMTSYTGTVTTEARDALGNRMASDFTWSFTTGAASDNTPPTVSSTFPAADQVGISVNSSVTATFSEAMLNSSLNTSSFSVTDVLAGTPVAGSVTVNGNTARFTPTGSAFLGSTLYEATVSTLARDAAGNPMAADYSWSFSTAAAPDTIPPSPILALVSPANNATNAALNSTIAVTFSEPMNNATINTSSFTVRTAGGSPVVGTVNITGNTARFTPIANLDGSTQYVASVTTAVQDAAGNAMAAPFSWQFTTGPAPDTTPPTVDVTSPSAGEFGVSLNAVVTATFSELMRNSTLTTASVRLVNAATSAPVAGTVATSGHTTTFTPLTNLEPNATYTATITTAARDAAGNPLASNHAWSFVTANTDVTAPTVTGTSPTSNQTGVDVASEVSATFSEEMSLITVNSSTFFLEQFADGLRLSGSVTLSGNTATLTIPGDLATATQYRATITSAARDAAGNPLAANYTWTFTTAAPTPSAILTWSPVADSRVAGYRVYYGTAPGVYDQALGSGIDVGNVTSHTVWGLTSGVTYYFAVTVYDLTNLESAYSNEVSKTP